MLSVQTLDVACAFALETRRESPFSDAILAHLSTRSAAIATTVRRVLLRPTVITRDGSTLRGRIAAHSLPPSRSAWLLLRRSPRCCLLRLLRPPRAHSRRPLPPTTPAAPQPPLAPVAPGSPPADAEEIARLEARLEELRRRNNNAGDAMEESDDDESMDGGGNMGYAGPEIFGPGRRLDSTETAPDPAPALAAAQEAEARRAAQEEQRRRRGQARVSGTPSPWTPSCVGRSRNTT